MPLRLEGDSSNYSVPTVDMRCLGGRFRPLGRAINSNIELVNPVSIQGPLNSGVQKGPCFLGVSAELHHVTWVGQLDHTG